MFAEFGWRPSVNQCWYLVTPRPPPPSQPPERQSQIPESSFSVTLPFTFTMLHFQPFAVPPWRLLTQRQEIIISLLGWCHTRNAETSNSRFTLFTTNWSFWSAGCNPYVYFPPAEVCCLPTQSLTCMAAVSSSLQPEDCHSPWTCDRQTHCYNLSLLFLYRCWTDSE